MTVPTAPEIFVHHVLFYAKATASEADKAALLEGLRKLVGIPGIKLAHIGVPAGTTRAVIDQSYTYSLLCCFESALEEQRYQAHPVHDAFRNQCAAYWDSVVIYDALGPAYGAAFAPQGRAQ